MTKPKSNAARLAARKASKPKSREQSVLAACKSPTRPKTKHGRIIAMLRTPAGATIAAIMTATDWQQHSVRGFLAGVVRKKLGLNLVSEQTDKGRLYRIKDGKASPAAADRAKQACSRWQTVFQRSAPAHLTRYLLFAVIAYRIQVDRYGDLDHATRQVLERTYSREARPAMSARLASFDQKRTELTPGTVLVD